MALIYQPEIFRQFTELGCAQSLRAPDKSGDWFNMSVSVAGHRQAALRNQARLAGMLGFSADKLAVGQQVHGSAVSVVDKDYRPGQQCDALMTNVPGWLLAVSVADCVPVLLYNPVAGVVAAVHSGWRGTLAAISTKAITAMTSGYGCRADDVYAYVGVAAGQCCYQVGDDVALRFDLQYSLLQADGKYLFDNRAVVIDQLIEAGVPAGQIQADIRCSICDPGFHSYRRDGTNSGRMFGAIGLRG